MDAENIRKTLRDAEEVKNNAFIILKGISGYANRLGGESIARDLIIRALSQRSHFGRYETLLDAIAQQVGLFPYVTPVTMGVRDIVAWEAHRPDGADKLGDSIAFHREQAEVYRQLMDGRNVVLSAPTSFGKSLIIDALIASERFEKVVVIVPTISLIDETRKRFGRFSNKYKLITHPDQSLQNRFIAIMTQERAIDRPDLTAIDLLVIDEFYKLSLPERGDSDRSAALNHAFYNLSKKSRQIYLLGPNIRSIPREFGERFKCTFIRTDYNTVVSELERLDPKPSRVKAFLGLAGSLNEPTLVYCKSPKQANEVMRQLAASLSNQGDEVCRGLSSWLEDTFHHDWSLVRAIQRGVGIHHGRLPRSIAQLMVQLFNDGRLKFLVCTSSLIEGVNTAAKNVVIYESKIGRPVLDYFTFKNISGRAGRMKRHFIGKVYTFDPPPEGELDFVDIPIITQDEDTPLGLLVQVDTEDLKEESSERLSKIYEQSALSLDVIKRNSHIDPEDQINLASEIERYYRKYQQLLVWSGPYPTWDQLLTCCELLYDFLVKNPRQGIRSGRQLAFRLSKLQDAETARRFISEVETTDRYVSSADEAVESAMEFIRNWATFHAPRYLMALERIQSYVFGKKKLRSGNYSVYASRLESLFLPRELVALDEYGLPIEVGRKIQDRLHVGNGLDAALHSLRHLEVDGLGISEFEKMLLVNCKNSL